MMDRGFDSPNLQVTDGRDDVVNSNFQFHYGSSLSSAVARMAEFKELVLSEEANIDFGTTARTSTTTFVFQRGPNHATATVVGWPNVAQERSA